MNFPAGGARSQFFSVQGARSDEYGVSSSDERRRNEGNRPQPSGSRRKSRHTSLSSSTVVPPQPSDSASPPPHGRRPVRGGPGLARFSSATRGPRRANSARWGGTPPTRKFITGSRLASSTADIRPPARREDPRTRRPSQRADSSRCPWRQRGHRRPSRQGPRRWPRQCR